MKNLHIFKPGKHVASNGTEITFTEADVRAIAENYDPALHEAPLVVGHPKHDGPAYGWVKALRFADGDLYADPDQVNSEFAEMLAAGSFKKRSAAFYPPGSPNNPTPDNYYLRHVGFLGAQPPAIKGLREVEFGEDEGLITVEFSEWGDRAIARTLRKLKNFLIGKFGQEEADQAIDEWEIEEITTEALRANESPEQPAFNESQTQEADEMTPQELQREKDQLAADKAEFAEQQNQLKRQQAELADNQVKIARAGHVAFCEELAAKGQLLPAHQAFAVEFMCGLDSTAAIEFGEGDEKQSSNQLDAFKDFLGSMPNLVEFAEIAANKDEAEAADNRDADDIARRAVAFQEAEAKHGRTVSIADAVTHVTRQQA